MIEPKLQVLLCLILKGLTADGLKIRIVWVATTWVKLLPKGAGSRFFQSLAFFLCSSPVTDLEWPRGFQEVKVPRFHDNGTGWW